MADSDWSSLSAPVHLTRNLTIAGFLSTPDDWPVIDLGFVAGKIMVAPGVALSFTRVVLVRWRRGPHFQAPGLDIIATTTAADVPPATAPATAWPHLVFQDMAWVQRGCLEPVLGRTVVNTSRRPAFAVGSQRLTTNVPQPGCSNATAARPLDRCRPLAVYYEDLVFFAYNLRPEDKTAVMAGYVLWLLGTQVKCEAVINVTCFNALGSLGCFYSIFPDAANASTTTLLLESTPPPPPPPPAQPGLGSVIWAADQPGAPRGSSGGAGGCGGGRSKSLVGPVVGGVVGGLALLAAAAAVAAVLLGARRRSTASEAYDKRKSDSDSGPLDAAVTVTHGTAAGPSKDTPDLASKVQTGGCSQGHMGSLGAAAAPGTAAGEAALSLAGSVLVPVTPRTPCHPGVNLHARLSCHVSDSVGAAAGCGEGSRGAIAAAASGGDSGGASDRGAATGGTEGVVTLLPSLIGKGAFGRVVEGLYGGQKVAVKLLNQGLMAAAYAGGGARGGAHQPEEHQQQQRDQQDGNGQGRTGDIPGAAAQQHAAKAGVPQSSLAIITLTCWPTAAGAQTGGAGAAGSTPPPAAVAAAAVPVPAAPADVTPAAELPVAGGAAAMAVAAGGRMVGAADLMTGTTQGCAPLTFTLMSQSLLASFETEGVHAQAAGLEANREAAAGAVAADEAAESSGGELEDGRSSLPSRPRDRLQLSLRREVEVLARLQHPNIVRLLAACLEPPHMCLVMELMETSLERLLYPREGPRDLLPLDKVLHIATQVAHGLAYLHPTVIHRDLKPANILISNAASNTPVVKLADFGLSRLQTTVLVTANVEAGTVPYMAPETLDVCNCVVTHHVDVYALGVLLFEMLSGLRPWAGQNMVQVALAVNVRRQRPPLELLGPGRCPDPLRALIQQCWEQEPQRRPAAQEVVKELLVLQQKVHSSQGLMEGDAAGLAPSPSARRPDPRPGMHPVGAHLARLRAMGVSGPAAGELAY